MLSNRMAQGLLFAFLLAAVALAQPGEAEAYNWRTATVDAGGGASFASVVVDTAGNVMISYESPQANDSLKFAICDRSASANGNCDQTADWRTVTVDSSLGWQGSQASMAVDGNGDPMISYWLVFWDGIQYHRDFKFAICDRSASTHGNCDQTADWRTAVIEEVGFEGWRTSIQVDGAGDPLISYSAEDPQEPKFAICDRSASTHGNCDQTGDWRTVTVEGGVDVGGTSLRLGDGDPMMSYGDSAGLRFTTCDRTGSTHGNCDQPGDWRGVTVDAAGGYEPSLAVDNNGDPMIVHYDWASSKKRFAICDRSASANGNCDQAGDWRVTAVDQSGNQGYQTSIAVQPDGDPIFAFNDLVDMNTDHYDLKLATCERSASTNGNCDQTGDWSTETVDAGDSLGPSLALDVDGYPIIAYQWSKDPSWETVDLKLAIGSPLAVGGIAELPDIARTSRWEAGAPTERSGWSAANFAALAGGVAAVVVAIGGGAWYAKRRWLR